MRVGHHQFTLAQLLMIVPLVAILVSFVNCGGCGRASRVVSSLEFSPDGTKVVVAADNWRDATVIGKCYYADVCRTLALIDTVSVSRPIVVKQEYRQGKQGPTLLWTNFPKGAFGADSTSLMVLWSDGGMRVWDVSSALWRDAAYAEGQFVSDFALSPNGDAVATATDDEVVLWETASQRQVWSLAINAQPVFQMPSIAFSPDGVKLAVADCDRVAVWDITSGTLLHEIWRGEDYDTVSFMEFSPDGCSVVLRCGKGLYMHDLCTHVDRVVLPEGIGPKGEVTYGAGDRTLEVTFSPDGRLLAAVGEYGVRLLDSKTWQQVGEEFCRQRVTAVAFAPDGKTLVTGNCRGKVIFWEVATRRQLRTVAMHGKSRTPWTVPLAMLSVWILLCCVSGVFHQRHRQQQSCDQVGRDGNVNSTKPTAPPASE